MIYSVSEKASEAIHHYPAFIGFQSHLFVSPQPIQMKIPLASV
jgi:hypothetical protein